jgi:hypothetical protein
MPPTSGRNGVAREGGTDVERGRDWHAVDGQRGCSVPADQYFMGVSEGQAGLIPHLPCLPGSTLLRFEPGAIVAYSRGEWQPVRFQPSARGA